jgi:hypothetical protein
VIDDIEHEEGIPAKLEKLLLVFVLRKKEGSSTEGDTPKSVPLFPSTRKKFQNIYLKEIFKIFI